MKKKLLLLCNDLGKSIFSHGIDILKEQYDVTIINRPQLYPTDLKSAKYSPLRLIKSLTSLRRIQKVDSDLLNTIGETKFDKFLVFGYYQINAAIVRKVKHNNPNCETIIYFYDSFCRLNFSNDIKHFDKCFTFDREDAINYSIEYLPFYAEKYDNTLVTYDLCHIGSWSPGHLYRLPCLAKLSEDLEKHHLTSYFKCTYYDISNFTLFRRIIFKVRAMFNKEFSLYEILFRKYKNSKILTKNRTSYEEMLAIESSSRCIVEINAQRAGLSPRVINALANGRKVIINNKCICDEIFYDENLVYIIDERNPTFDMNFLFKESKNIDMSDLFLQNWLSIILENKTNKYAIK